jgi:hypothetical protein
MMREMKEECVRIREQLDRHEQELEGIRQQSDRRGQQLDGLKQRLDRLEQCSDRTQLSLNLMPRGLILDLECEPGRCIRKLLIDMARKAVAGAGPALAACLLEQLASADIWYFEEIGIPAKYRRAVQRLAHRVPATHGTKSSTSGRPG